MSTWRIEFTRRFLKDIEKVPGDIYERLLEVIEDIKANPYLGKRLTGSLRGFYSWRVGDYRIIYRIDEDRKVIVLFRFGHRKHIYDRLLTLLLLILLFITLRL